MQNSTLFLVRHGQVLNPQKIIYGNLPGFGLSKQGVNEIEIVSEYLLKNAKDSTIYSSPLQRTIETSKIISKKTRSKIIIENRIRETEIGNFEGKSFNILPKNYINEKGLFKEIESSKSIRNRFLDWIETIKYEKKTVIAVSHKDPIIVLILHFMKKGIEDINDIKVNTGGLYKVEFGKNIIIENIL